MSLLVGLGFSRTEALTVWRPLALYALGLVLYSVFIFNFYRFVARRDILELELKKYASGFTGVVRNFFRVLLYLLQYLLLYPFLSVVWFCFFTLFLTVMAPGFPANRIVLVSMSVVTAIRATSYYSENLSQDLAKLIPLSLLGVFLVEGAIVFSIPDLLSKVSLVFGQWRTFSYYLLLLVAVEMVLRITTWIVNGTPETKILEKEETG